MMDRACQWFHGQFFTRSHDKVRASLSKIVLFGAVCAVLSGGTIIWFLDRGSRIEERGSRIEIEMSEEDKRVFEDILLTLNELDDAQYFEWGTGGSTKFAAMVVRGANHNAIAHSVEHYEPWCTKMQEDPSVKAATHFGNMDYRCVDTKQPLMKMGYPAEGANVTAVALTYVGEIDNVVLDNEYDVVLVDGRFRVACVLRLITGKYIGRESVLMVHDYQDRPHYHIVSEFFEQIREDETKTLGVFRIKDEIDEDKLAAAVEEYRLDPR